MKFKGLLLDIDNTLYDYAKSHRTALDAVCNILKEKYSLDKKTINVFYRKARTQIHKELSETASCHNRLLYFQRMFELLDINALESPLALYNIYWDTFLDNLTVYDGVYDFLNFIRNIKICLISDLTTDIQHRKIQKMKLFDYAHFLVTSEEVGREKPHPYLFKAALKKLRLKPSQVCMIGDDYEKDIIGAANLGINSFWLNINRKRKRLNKLITGVRNFNELIECFK